MSDDTTTRGKQDRERININEKHDLEYWTGRLGVSEDELRDAVQRVGPMVEDVQREIKRAS
jgi:hypothetical protein